MKIGRNSLAVRAAAALFVSDEYLLACDDQSSERGFGRQGACYLPRCYEGKTVAYLPLALSFDLTQGWLEGLKRELEPLGVKIIVRDANWDFKCWRQALTTLISQKPDAIIVHNPDLQTYAKLIKRAETPASR